ncbi:MAG TPA: endonuclease/exonuclease/phosphatase family protein [Desulfotignum sp.]|nr:endonuclease/exonuclease/phosphatase family protein [Desulfotignum sp.]
MFKPEIPLLRSPLILENKIIPRDFGILCWNVHKENLKPEFDTMVKNWIRLFDMNILLFQEAVFPDNLFSVAGLSYAAAANIRIHRLHFGVLTAAMADIHTKTDVMSLARESMVATRKNALITRYWLSSGELLLVVNIHAVNFTSRAWYLWEFSRLLKTLQHHQGPLVLAGDFNCWNRSRQKIVNNLAQALSLRQARPRRTGLVKQFFGFELDRIYYRQLSLLEMDALENRLFSDHNPLVARFACKPAQ